MKLLVLLLVFTTALNCQEEFNMRVYKHLHSWGDFLFDYLGCPQGADTVRQCKPKLGHIDRTKFKASCKSARELFQFKDKEACE